MTVPLELHENQKKGVHPHARKNPGHGNGRRCPFGGGETFTAL
jgi:hypothetical protein